MGVLTQYGSDIGGIDPELISKIGTDPLNTTAQNLSGAINEHETSILSIINNKVNKSGDTMTGTLTMAGQDILLGTSSSSSNDSADIVWNYGNGQEKSRIWTANTYSTSEKLGPNYRVYAEDGTSVLSGRLMVTTGDTMSGALTFNKVANAIYYTGTKASYPMIKFIDNTADEYGNGIAIGGGGATIIGGGESSSAMTGAVSTGGDEILYLGNDGNVNVFSNLQNGWASRKSFTFDTNGNFSADAGYLKSTCNGNTVSIGSQNNSWCHIYNTANVPFIFNKTVATTTGDLGTTEYRWGAGYFKGNIQILTASPTMDVKSTNFQMNKTSNNSCTTGTQIGYVMSSNGTGYVGRCVLSADTAGSFNLKLQVRNYKTDGTLVDNAMGATITKAGAQTYNINNAANFRSAIGAAASSSRLTKTNIQDMTYEEASKIFDINVVSFDYKDGFVNSTDVKEKYYGVIAEDTMDKLPYVVNIPEDYSEETFKEEEGLNQNLIMVDYVNFIPYLLKVVQNQEEKINELESKIK